MYFSFQIIVFRRELFIILFLIKKLPLSQRHSYIREGFRSTGTLNIYQLRADTNLNPKKITLSNNSIIKSIAIMSA